MSHRLHTDKQIDNENSSSQTDENNSGPYCFSKSLKLARSYFITLKPDPATCLTHIHSFVSSIVAQINSRSHIPSALPLSRDYYAETWLNISEVVVRSSVWYPGEWSSDKWVEEWAVLRSKGECDVEEFNWLARCGIVHCAARQILVFDGRNDGSVKVISPCELGGKVEGDPIVLAVDGASYRGLSPLSNIDECRIKFLVEVVQSGNSDPFNIRQRMLQKFCFARAPSSLESASKSRHTLSRKSLKRLKSSTKSFGPRLNDGIFDPPRSCVKKRYKNILPHRDFTMTGVEEEEDRENYNLTISKTGVQFTHPLMKQGILLAKEYFINVRAGTPNARAGNCSIESVLDQINSRACYSAKLPHSVQHYREEWMGETERVARNSAYFLEEFSEEEWSAAWSRLHQDGQYEVDYFGDLMLIGIMHCVRKNALVFNASNLRAHGPLTVIRGDHFGAVLCDEDPPLVLAYNGSHYESLFPESQRDEEKTAYIVKHWSSYEGADMRTHLMALDWFTDVELSD